MRAPEVTECYLPDEPVPRSIIHRRYGYLTLHSAHLHKQNRGAVIAKFRRPA